VSGSDEFEVSDQVFVIDALCGCNVRVWLFPSGTLGTPVRSRNVL